MKKNYKISVVFVLFVFLMLLIPPVSAADIPEGFIEISNQELEEVKGMGQFFNVEQTDLSGISFRYTGTYDKSFQNATGILNVTNISGDENIVNNIVNLDITIITINGTKNINFSDVMDYIE